jgi:hypothetical protein
MTNPKTATNPKGGGRVKGKIYPGIIVYPGQLSEYRLSFTRMRAQAKFRKEEFTLTWDEYQEIWADKWHLKGRASDDLCLSRIDWAKGWNIDNVSLVFRVDHLRKQCKERPSSRGIKKGPRKPKQ